MVTIVRKIKMIKLKRNKNRTFKIDLGPSPGDARTLPATNGFIKKTGWTIKGEIHEDYWEWINEFKASHPKYGKVWGDFEGVVCATSKKAYTRFVKDHPYEEWDYGDI